ncbi:hypothetical protein IJJ37_02600 [Candidatus Saccharibacteria bacterium]|nr:hypothetical protein [Candidatus Saccharibacteria bacterium]
MKKVESKKKPLDAEKNYDLVDAGLVKYVKEKIFPRYNTANGHGLDHIQNVIRRSLDFAKRINEGEIVLSPEDFANLPTSLANGKINYDMCFATAAFHDLGRDKNNKLHHLVSAGYFLLDDFMEEFFSRDELRVVADAIMDHRASNELDPLTIYGRIVSSADRDTDCYDIMRRAYAYNHHLNPEQSEDETIQRTYDKICLKFVGSGAYGAKKMYFENPEFEAMLREFEVLTADAEKFRAKMLELIHGD